MLELWLLLDEVNLTYNNFGKWLVLSAPNPKFFIGLNECAYFLEYICEKMFGFG